jgi:hypothetical protein
MCFCIFHSGFIALFELLVAQTNPKSIEKHCVGGGLVKERSFNSHTYETITGTVKRRRMERQMDKLLCFWLVNESLLIFTTHTQLIYAPLRTLRKQKKHTHTAPQE